MISILRTFDPVTLYSNFQKEPLVYSTSRYGCAHGLLYVDFTKFLSLDLLYPCSGSDFEGSDTSRCSKQTADQLLYFIYFPDGSAPSINIPEEYKELHIQWFDPSGLTMTSFTGGRSKIIDASGWQDLGSKPFQKSTSDWVIVVSEKGLAMETIAASCNHCNAKRNWRDSYSVNGRCYCDTNGDHGVFDLVISSPTGNKTVGEVCNRNKELFGEGPVEGRIPYNDVQCGNGPANDAGDEDPENCPGRVDLGPDGCKMLGPSFNLEELFGVL
eukprot:m.122494 g.122494  ORF g.122494 m.122494 type:complete len:271 (+) comp14426_c0_seq2:2522-3334(+)